MSATSGLHIPPAPDGVDPLGGPSDRLVHAGPARRRAFLAASPTVEARGTETDGLDRVDARGVELLRSLRTGAGPCSNVLVGPRSVRRELVGAGGTVLETVLVADRHPGVVVQWDTPSGGALALDVRWEVPGVAVAQRSSGPILRVRPRRGPDRLFAVLPEATRREMEVRSGALGVRVRVRAAEGPVSLLAAAVAPDADGADVLRVLAGARALETRAATFVHRVREELLATRTGVPEIDDGLAWAVARTASGSGAGVPSAAGSLERLWMLAGRLATGARRTARSLVGGPPADPADALALGWWVAWTGELATFRRHRDAALDVLARPSSGRGGPTAFAPPVHRAAREAVALALEALGDEASARRLVSAEPGPPRDDTAAAGATGTDADRSPRAAMRLPVLGDARTGDDEEAILAAVLGHPGPGAMGDPPAPPTGVPRALRAWALYAVGRPDEAYLLLREHLEEGVRGSPGLWASAEDPERPHDPQAAALAPAVVLHGLLGARAEAPWGRLRLAPALPSSWARFRAAGIRVGDARVALAYARREGTHTFTVEQTAGRVPLDLVLEPSVPGRVDEVRVDGASADLAVEARSGRSRVRLQIPLDAQRTVTLARSQP